MLSQLTCHVVTLVLHRLIFFHLLVWTHSLFGQSQVPMSTHVQETVLSLATPILASQSGWSHLIGILHHTSILLFTLLNPSSDWKWLLPEFLSLKEFTSSLLPCHCAQAAKYDELSRVVLRLWQEILSLGHNTVVSKGGIFVFMQLSGPVQKTPLAIEV